MSQDQLIMHERESQDLRKRNQQLQDQYARLDVASNHATEELASAHDQIERLRNECSNLRAEKKIWEVSGLFYNFFMIFWNNANIAECPRSSTRREQDSFC